MIPKCNVPHPFHSVILFADSRLPMGTVIRAVNTVSYRRMACVTPEMEIQTRAELEENWRQGSGGFRWTGGNTIHADAAREPSEQ